VGDQKPLSILQICSATRAVYGAVESLMTLANAQRRSGHRVEFVTFKGKPFTQDVLRAGFRCHEVSVRLKLDLAAAFRIRKMIRNGRFDVVHTHLSTSSVNGCLAARLARVPAISTVHGMSGKLSFVFSDRLIAVSQNVRSHLVSQGVPATKVSVVYNGLDFTDSRHDQESARRSFEIYGSPVMGTVARVTENKGINYALEAVSMLLGRFPDLRYVVAGSGNALDACRDQANALGIDRSVMFLGYQSDVASVLTSLDLFLFPSLKEAMGIALVEAMACRLPIVATTVGGIPEVVTPSCGVLVPPRSPESLAEACAGLLENDLQRLAMGEAAHQRAHEVFSVGAMHDGVEAVYRSELGQASRPRKKTLTPIR
jgi:glycosyltransferase involved in cell wall biosynthesis